MRKPLVLFLFLCAALATAMYAPLDGRASGTSAQSPSSTTPTTLPPIIQSPSSVPSAPAIPPTPAAPAPAVLTIVVDAAHGGADNGARGPSGLNEKDVVLALARGVRAELTRQGYRVVMTRDSDADPTFDDRAAMANQFADAIFVSLHVASTGTAGTVRVYYYKLSIPFTFSAADTGAPSAGTVAQQPQSGVPAAADGEKLVPWRQAQSLSIGGSQRLAELVQSGLAQKFPGSPAGSTSAAVRDLRSVTAPAIAIEISNISAPKVTTLEEMSPAIAAAIAQSVAVFHPAGIINGSSSSTGAAH